MRTLLAALLVPLSLLAAPSTAQAAPSHPGTLTLSTAKVSVGEAVTAEGTFRKAYAGRKVAIQVAAGGAWKTLARKKATAKGTYAIVVQAPATPGTAKLRAYVAGKGKSRPATSPVRTLKVSAPDGPGSLDQPYAVGQGFTSGSWSFTFARTDTDAWPELAAADPDNVAPAPGWAYVLVPVTFRNGSTTATEPFWPTEIDLLGGDDEYYTDSTDDQSCGTVPDDWSEAAALAPGASVTANVCAVVPTSALAGGLWSVVDDDADDESFVRLG